MSAKVADVMTRKVIAVREGATFKEIAARLQDDHSARSRLSTRTTR